MKALVTGGAGFIGHHLVRALLDRGDTVAVIDNFATGLSSRLIGRRSLIRLVEGDIRDPRAVNDAIAGCEVVFHQAALPSVARSIRDPRETNDVNTNGTIEVMQAAVRAGVWRVIFAGSSSIYGTSPELPRRESQRPDPRSPYATSKIAAEYYVHTIGGLGGIETVVLRYFNIFGPGQDPASEYAAVMPRFVSAALLGQHPVVHGDGSQSRDFTYIDNVVSANLLAAAVPDVSGLTCNIGCGERYTLIELLGAIERAAGVVLAPDFGPPRPGDVPHSQADISQAKDRLGYAVMVPFEEGVRRTVEWFREDLDD